MRMGPATALGIDISEHHIALALLKKDSQGLHLLKAATGPVPEGVIENGNVEDPEMLSKAIKRVMVRNRIRARQVAISVVVEPVLMQIVDMPKQVPKNVRQFVREELKQYVALSGDKVVSDFCGISAGAQLGKNRILVVATDNAKVVDIVKKCAHVGVNVEAVEPSLLAYARAIYADKIATKLDCNVLIAVLQGGVLSLCVFRKHSLDFVRTKDITAVVTDSDKLCPQIAEEINAVTQFYDVEVPDNAGKWEIILVADDTSLLSANAEKFLKNAVVVSNFEIKTPEDLCQFSPVVGDSAAAEINVTAASVGLAMKLLGRDESNLTINLLPSEAVESKSLKKQAIITANVLGVILFIMVLAVAGLTLMIERMNENIARTRQAHSLYDMRRLVNEKKLLETQIEQLSTGPRQLDEILRFRNEIDWAGILNDIRSVAPENVCITKLVSKSDAAMSLEGLALSYDTVHLFVNLLDKSQHIESASVNKAQKNPQDGLIRYAINCSLAAKKGR